jgi:hypothetical protein
MSAQKFFLNKIACVFFALKTCVSCGASDERDMNTPLSPRSEGTKTIQFSLPQALGPIVPLTGQDFDPSLPSAQYPLPNRHRAQISKLVLPAIFERGEETPILARSAQGLKPNDFSETTFLPVSEAKNTPALGPPSVPALILPVPCCAGLSPASSSSSGRASSPISPVGLSSKRLMSFEELSYLVAVRDMSVPEFSGNLFEDLERHQSILMRASADRREQAFAAFCKSPFLGFYREAQHNKRTLLTQHVQSLFPLFLCVVKSGVDFIENYQQKILYHRQGKKVISPLGLETSVSLIGDIYHFFCKHGSRMSHFYTAVLTVASESDRDAFEVSACDYAQDLSPTGEVMSLTFIQRFYLEAPHYLLALKSAYETGSSLPSASGEDGSSQAQMGVSSPRARAGSSPRGKLSSFVTPQHLESSKIQAEPARTKSFKATPRETRNENTSDLLPFSWHEETGEGEIASPREGIQDMREFLPASAPASVMESDEPSPSKHKKKSLFSGFLSKAK